MGVLRLQALLSFPATIVAVVLVVAIVLSLAEVSNLLVAYEDNFLKYEYNNEVSSHQEVLYS